MKQAFRDRWLLALALILSLGAACSTQTAPVRSGTEPNVTAPDGVASAGSSSVAPVSAKPEPTDSPAGGSPPAAAGTTLTISGEKGPITITFPATSGDCPEPQQVCNQEGDCLCDAEILSEGTCTCEDPGGGAVERAAPAALAKRNDDSPAARAKRNEDCSCATGSPSPPRVSSCEAKRVYCNRSGVCRCRR